MWFGQAFRARVGLALIGTAAGLAAWALVRNMALAASAPQTFLFTAAFAATFFSAALMIIGPLRLRRALPSALALALILAALFTWASLRFDSLAAYLSTPERLMAAALLFVLPLPYIIAANGPGWRHYPTLFAQAWSLLIRALGAWVFVGALWLLLFLSNTLLQLVGVRAIARLLEVDGAAWAVTGAMFGLGLAVVNEVVDYVSPFLTLRFLRMLMPVALAVSLTFLAALPLHGLSSFFGGISSAQTLLAMAIGCATLVSAALAESDEDVAPGRLLRRTTQGLALVLPVLAGLGAAAVWIRVAQYGWTPPRLASALIAAIMLGYGGIYALAVLRGAGWAARIRAGNAVMALLVIAVLALTFTPALNAERISAQSQLSRYLAGKSSLAELDVAALRDRWGRPGAAALARLTAEAQKPGQAALKARLAAAAQPGADDRDAARKALAAELRRALPLRPEAKPGSRQPLLAALLARASTADLREWLQACRHPLPDGKPGCVLLSGAFLPDAAGSQALFLYRTQTGVLRAEGVVLDPDGSLTRAPAMDLANPVGPAADPGAVIAAALDGTARLAPAPINALTLSGHRIVILPGGR